jgi:hypothetical protein
MKNLTNAEWTAIRENWGLRPSQVSHFWGTMPPEFQEGEVFPFLVEGDQVTFFSRTKRDNGKEFPAVEFQYWEGGVN